MARLTEGRRASGNPWAYVPGNTFLHRAPVFLKFACLSAITAAALLFHLPGIAAGWVLVLTAAAAAGLSPPELFRGSRAALGMILLAALLRTLRLFPPGADFSGLGDTAFFCAAVLLSFCAGSLFFRHTPMSAVRESFSRFPGPRAGLAFSLMLGFMPRFFDAWEESRDAWKARGGRMGPGAVLKLLPLTIARMITLAGEAALAMESRGARV